MGERFGSLGIERVGVGRCMKGVHGMVGCGIFDICTLFVGYSIVTLAPVCSNAIECLPPLLILASLSPLPPPGPPPPVQVTVRCT